MGKSEVLDLANMVVRGTPYLGCGCGSCRAQAEDAVTEPRTAMEEAFIHKRLKLLSQGKDPSNFRVGKITWYRDENGNWTTR